MLFSRVASDGFTRKEILIVSAFALLMVAVIFIILNPNDERRAARDAARWADVSVLMTAIKINQAAGDNQSEILPGVVYMITRGVVTTGCDDYNAVCALPVTGDTECRDLSGLVTAGRLAEVPVSPPGKNKWAAPITGYILWQDADGILTVAACEAENTAAIWVAR